MHHYVPLSEDSESDIFSITLRSEVFHLYFVTELFSTNLNENESTIFHYTAVVSSFSQIIYHYITDRNDNNKGSCNTANHMLEYGLLWMAVRDKLSILARGFLLKSMQPFFFDLINVPAKFHDERPCEFEARNTFWAPQNIVTVHFEWYQNR